MSEDNSHNNPWADKLQNLPVPDVNDNWNNMQALLNKEMPVVKNNSNLKWFLLLLLLLLVIGICNCPGLRHENKISRKDATNPFITNLNRQQATNPVTDTVTGKPVIKTFEGTEQDTDKITSRATKAPDADNISNTVARKTGNANSKKQTYISDRLYTPDHHALFKKGDRNNATTPGTKQIRLKTKAKTGGRSNIVKAGYHKSTHSKINESNKEDRSRISLVNKNRPKKEDQDNKKPINDIDSVTAPKKNTDTGKVDSGYRLTDTSAITRKDQVIDSLKKDDSSSGKILLAHSIKKQTEKGFVIAIGLNQFFAVGGQQHSSYNSKGTSGVLADYIPVPQIRYHFNKKLYAQLEAQFNAPQYTGNILARQSRPDSTRPGPPSQQSVYIKKLFYFNLPFSMHYSPAKHFYLGAGLQFSQLKNAVGLYENKRLGSSVPDTGNTAKFQSLKSDDTTYSLLKTNECRFLVDANYQWKRITFGLRYNQAFNYFINVRISNTEISQARNNSLQLYLRYDIWDGRRKSGIGYRVSGIR